MCVGILKDRGCYRCAGSWLCWTWIMEVQSKKPVGRRGDICLWELCECHVLSYFLKALALCFSCRWSCWGKLGECSVRYHPNCILLTYTSSRTRSHTHHIRTLCPDRDTYTSPQFIPSTKQPTLPHIIPLPVSSPPTHPACNS